MPYFVIDNFGGGIDNRRNVASGPNRTLRDITNAFVNRGGEIEKRKKWFRIEDLTDETTNASNRLKTVGPIRSMDRDAVFFLCNTEPSAAGEWSTDAGGVIATDGEYRFGLYALSALSAQDVRAVSATELYPDEILVTYLDAQTVAAFGADQFMLSVSTGNVCPSSDAAVAGRSSFLGGGGAVATDFVARFNSCYYVDPNFFDFIKSDTNNPDADGGTGAGSFDVRGQGVHIGRPFAIELYYSQVAIFGEAGIHFWAIDSDPNNIVYQRGIEGEALVGLRTPLPYGDGDVLYLTANGIRSLRARDSSNLAEVTDIGSPIDANVSLRLEVADAAMGRTAHSIVHEGLGQAWFIVGQKIYVLSRYPSADVLAWSVFDTPDIDANLTDLSLQLGPGVDLNTYVLSAAPIGDTICLHMGTDEVFIYGDTSRSNNQYDTSTATVTTHYLSLGKPSTYKTWTAIDVIGEGSWTVSFSTDPDNESFVEIATAADITTLNGAIRFEGRSTHIALKLENTTAEQGKISEIILHYTEDGEAS